MREYVKNIINRVRLYLLVRTIRVRFNSYLQHFHKYILENWMIRSSKLDENHYSTQYKYTPIFLVRWYWSFFHYYTRLVALYTSCSSLPSFLKVFVLDIFNGFRRKVSNFFSSIRIKLGQIFFYRSSTNPAEYYAPDDSFDSAKYSDAPYPNDPRPERLTRSYEFRAEAFDNQYAFKEPFVFALLSRFYPFLRSPHPIVSFVRIYSDYNLVERGADEASELHIFEIADRFDEDSVENAEYFLGGFVSNLLHLRRQELNLSGVHAAMLKHDFDIVERLRLQAEDEEMERRLELRRKSKEQKSDTNSYPSELTADIKAKESWSFSIVVARVYKFFLNLFYKFLFYSLIFFVFFPLCYLFLRQLNVIDFYDYNIGYKHIESMLDVFAHYIKGGSNAYRGEYVMFTGKQSLWLDINGYRKPYLWFFWINFFKNVPNIDALFSLFFLIPDEYEFEEPTFIPFRRLMWLFPSATLVQAVLDISALFWYFFLWLPSYDDIAHTNYLYKSIKFWALRQPYCESHWPLSDTRVSMLHKYGRYPKCHPHFSLFGKNWYIKSLVRYFVPHLDSIYRLVYKIEPYFSALFYAFLLICTWIVGCQFKFIFLAPYTYIKTCCLQPDLFFSYNPFSVLIKFVDFSIYSVLQISFHDCFTTFVRYAIFLGVPLILLINFVLIVFLICKQLFAFVLFVFRLVFYAIVTKTPFYTTYLAFYLKAYWYRFVSFYKNRFIFFFPTTGRNLIGFRERFRFFVPFDSYKHFSEDEEEEEDEDEDEEGDTPIPNIFWDDIEDVDEDALGNFDDDPEVISPHLYATGSFMNRYKRPQKDVDAELPLPNQFYFHFYGDDDDESERLWTARFLDPWTDGDSYLFSLKLAHVRSGKEDLEDTFKGDFPGCYLYSPCQDDILYDYFDIKRAAVNSRCSFTGNKALQLENYAKRTNFDASFYEKVKPYSKAPFVIGHYIAYNPYLHSLNGFYSVEPDDWLGFFIQNDYDARFTLLCLYRLSFPDVYDRDFKFTPVQLEDFMLKYNSQKLLNTNFFFRWIEKKRRKFYFEDIYVEHKADLDAYHWRDPAFEPKIFKFLVERKGVIGDLFSSLNKYSTPRPRDWQFWNFVQNNFHNPLDVSQEVLPFVLRCLSLYGIFFIYKLGYMNLVIAVFHLTLSFMQYGSYYLSFPYSSYLSERFEAVVSEDVEDDEWSSGLTQMLTFYPQGDDEEFISNTEFGLSSNAHHFNSFQIAYDYFYFAFFPTFLFLVFTIFISFFAIDILGARSTLNTKVLGIGSPEFFEPRLDSIGDDSPEESTLYDFFCDYLLIVFFGYVACLCSTMMPVEEWLLFIFAPVAGAFFYFLCGLDDLAIIKIYEEYWPPDEFPHFFGIYWDYLWIHMAVAEYTFPLVKYYGSRQELILNLLLERKPIFLRKAGIRASRGYLDNFQNRFWMIFGYEDAFRRLKTIQNGARTAYAKGVSSLLVSDDGRSLVSELPTQMDTRYVDRIRIETVSPDHKWRSLQIRIFKRRLKVMLSRVGWGSRGALTPERWTYVRKGRLERLAEQRRWVT